MIDHTGIAAPKFDASARLYDAVFPDLGGGRLMTVPMAGGVHVVGHFVKQPVFWLHEGGDAGPGRHIALAARTRAEVDAVHQAALAAGGTDIGAPGLRPQNHPDHYGAFAVEPDGNNVEAVCDRTL